MIRIDWKRSVGAGLIFASFFSSESFAFFDFFGILRSTPKTLGDAQLEIKKACSSLKIDYFREASDAKRILIRAELACLNGFLINPTMVSPSLTSDCEKFVIRKLTEGAIFALNDSKNPVLTGTPLCESPPISKIPSLVELVDGSFHEIEDLSKPSEISQGDIIYLHTGIPFVQEHMLIAERSNLFYHTNNNGTSLTSSLPPQGIRGGVFRFRDERILNFMKPFVYNKIETSAQFAPLKGAQSFLFRGRLTQTRKDEVRIVKALLKNTARSQLTQIQKDKHEQARLKKEKYEAIRMKRPLTHAQKEKYALQIGKRAEPELKFQPALQDSRAEICSTYVGNAVVLGALASRIEAHYQQGVHSELFYDQVDRIVRIAQRSQQVRMKARPLPSDRMKQVNADLEKRLEEAANLLVDDVETRKMLEFGTPDSPRSKLFDRNLDQMTPAAVIQFLTELSSSECEFSVLEKRPEISVLEETPEVSIVEERPEN